jgi:hypothetical protein
MPEASWTARSRRRGYCTSTRRKPALPAGSVTVVVVEVPPEVIDETQVEHLFTCLKAGTVTTNVLLRELHNFCIQRRTERCGAL